LEILFETEESESEDEKEDEEKLQEEEQRAIEEMQKTIEMMEEKSSSASSQDESYDPLDHFMTTLYDGSKLEVREPSPLPNSTSSTSISLEQIMEIETEGGDPKFVWESDSEMDEEREEEDLDHTRFVEELRKMQEEKEEEEKNQKKEAEVGEVGERMFADEGDVMEESERNQEDALEAEVQEILAVENKRKELGEIDHDAIDYMAFRKNLYIVPRSLATLSKEEVDIRRMDLEIHVRGKAIPPPVSCWEECGFSERMGDVVRGLNFNQPFPIQQQALPALMGGRDIIGIARTGSGKTLAFLLPLIRHVLDQPHLMGNESGPIGLILSPTRELAAQITKDARDLCKPLGLSVCSICGGKSMVEQIKSMKRGTEIVVATPGRLIDLLTMNNVMTLTRCSFLILDEADRMFDLGFEPQVNQIVQNIRPDRQTALFSATFPRSIERCARRILSHPIEMIVGGRTVANKNINQIAEIREDSGDKDLRVLQLLGGWSARMGEEKFCIIIFVNTQNTGEMLYLNLRKCGYGNVTLLHAGREQADRDDVISTAKKEGGILVATGVAGRGLDIPHCVCVINYDCPNHLGFNN